MKDTILILLIFTFFLITPSFAQYKILFDASKAETAGNADWIIDADNWDLDYSSGQAYIGGDEARAQRIPTPDQSQITASTNENFWTGALSSWAIELVKAGYAVETLPFDGKITYGDKTNTQDLANYNMFVVCEPNFPFSDAEKSAILNFVRDGGVLFMIADHANSDRDGDGWDSPEIWNDLMFNNSVQNNPFGIKFNLVDIDDDTKIIVSNDPVTYGQFGQVSNVEFYAGTTMTLYPDANATVKGLVYQSSVGSVGGTTNVMVATARYGAGIVFALGDSSPIDDGSGDYNDRLYDGWIEDAAGSHRIMIMNASVWALENTTSANSDNNLPFVITTSELTVTIQSKLPINLTIYSVTGQKLFYFQNTYTSVFTLPTSGIYIIKSDKFSTKIAVTQ